MFFYVIRYSVQNAAFKSICIIASLQQCLTCKILFILSQCLHTTKHLRKPPIPVLAESFPVPVNNCEKWYWQQACKFTCIYRNRQPTTSCTRRPVLFYCQGFHFNHISNNEHHCLKYGRPKCAVKTLALAVHHLALCGTLGRNSIWMPLALVSKALLQQQEMWIFKGVYFCSLHPALSTSSAFPIPTPACSVREEV